MKTRTLTLTILLTVLAAAWTGRADNYYSATKPDWPPLPFAPLNVAPENITEVEPGYFVYDDSPEARANGRIQMDDIEYGEDPGTPPDTNGWMGTWIIGLPLLDANTNVTFATPALWTVMCTNAGYSEYPHVKVNWYSWTKVCPGDLVYVLWPPAATNGAVPYQNSFVIVQQGTNDSGANFTNAYLATINTSQGCWASWTIPAWPTIWPNQVGCGFLNAWMATNCCSGFTNSASTNSGPNTNFTLHVCVSFVTPYQGPYNFPATNGPWINPDRPPRVIIAPGDGALCEVPYWPPGEFPKFDDPLRPPTQNEQCIPDVPPPQLNGGGFLPRAPWVHAIKLSDGTYQDSTNVTELATNTLLLLPMSIHGVPNTAYEFQSSTDLVNWVLEGNTNFVTDANGQARPILWSTNYLDFQENAKHYRVRQQ